MVAKQLSKVIERIPVQIILVNFHSVKLNNGTTLRNCIDVSRIQQLGSAIQQQPLERFRTYQPA